MLHSQERSTKRGDGSLVDRLAGETWAAPGAEKIASLCSDAITLDEPKLIQSSGIAAASS
jgi:hypothetical protein